MIYFVHIYGFSQEKVIRDRTKPRVGNHTYQNSRQACHGHQPITCHCMRSPSRCMRASLRWSCRVSFMKRVDAARCCFNRLLPTQGIEKNQLIAVRGGVLNSCLPHDRLLLLLLLFLTLAYLINLAREIV